MSKKIKILTLSDHPLSPSGVGSQTKYVCEALLKTGRYSIISLGGAIKHENYQPIAVEPYEEDWKIIPVDGYGTQEMVRSILSALSKIYFMSAESRKEMGMKGRNHVLQNYSFEKFNKQWVELMDSIIEKHGSWQNRSQYNGVYFGEVA